MVVRQEASNRETDTRLIMLSLRQILVAMAWSTAATRGDQWISDTKELVVMLDARTGNINTSEIPETDETFFKAAKLSTSRKRAVKK